MANRPLDLLVNTTEDAVTRENFDRVRQFIASDLFTKFDGKFYEFNIRGIQTNLKIPHKLGFIPKDSFLTFESSIGGVILNRHLFDKENFDITTTGDVSFRLVSGQFVTDR